MSRGKYAGQPLSFKCPGCFVLDGKHRFASDVTLTGRKRHARSLKLMNYHDWPDEALEYVCPCGHRGWSRHPDLARYAKVAEGVARPTVTRAGKSWPRA